MDGVHDVGGMHGFGRVEPEPNEPVFHHPWEKKVFGIRRVLGARGLYSLDEARYASERMDPAEYLRASYYERWLASTERLLIDKGVVSQAELDAKLKQFQQNPEQAVPRRDDPAFTERFVAALRDRVRGGRSAARDAVAPRFAAGDRVRTRNFHPRGHTRLPRYARGKRGVIDRIHGTFVTPDTNALGKGEHPQPVYSVRFAAQELWGADAEPNQRVYLDLWESYLEPA